MTVSGLTITSAVRSGDARCAGEGDSGTRGSPRPQYDAAVQAPESRADQGAIRLLDTPGASASCGNMLAMGSTETA